MSEFFGKFKGYLFNPAFLLAVVVVVAIVAPFLIRLAKAYVPGADKVIQSSE